MLVLLVLCCAACSDAAETGLTYIEDEPITDVEFGEIESSQTIQAFNSEENDKEFRSVYYKIVTDPDNVMCYLLKTTEGKDVYIPIDYASVELDENLAESYYETSSTSYKLHGELVNRPQYYIYINQ